MTSSSRRTPPPSNRTRPGRTYRGTPERSFLERNRSRLLWGLAGLALVAVASLAFFNATSPAYACNTQWEPAVTPEPAPGATPRLGYVQDDFGARHEAVGEFVRYAFCPPASGRHYNAEDEGPVHQGVFGPDDQALPQGWIHNLEHGGIVVLYRCAEGDSACDEAGQAALTELYSTMPASPVCNLPPAQTTVVARFDQMRWPYAAILWGQVLPLEAFDAQLIRDFFAQQGERSNPELLCAKPTATPAPAATPAPTGTPAPSEAPTAAPTPTPAPSATPAAS